VSDFIEEAQSKTRPQQRPIAKKSKTRASDEDPKELDNNATVKSEAEKRQIL